MNRDLEDQLDEMGPEYRAVVARLRGAREAVPRRGSFVSRLTSYLTAASLLALSGLGIHFARTLDVGPKTRDVGFAPREYRATVSEMIATQNPDGSWQNDFLTRRNADALKGLRDPAAAVAYKKAVRNLRSRGLL